MMRISRGTSFLVLGIAALTAGAQQSDEGPAKKADQTTTDAKAGGKAAETTATAAPDSITENTVTAGGTMIAYRAVAGTLTVGATDAYDTLLGLDGRLLPDSGMNPPDPAKPEDAPATAR